MWPWGHLAVGYLLYTAYTHRRFDRPPLAAPAIALAVGSQFPDLVDKPLAWTVSVLPGGRTLGHSLLFAAILVPTVYLLAARLERRDVGIAFVIGHLSHLSADIPPSALTGDLSGTEFLLWPFVAAPEEEPVGGILDAVLHYYAMGPYEWFQLGLFVLAAIVWYRDGAPGLEYARRTLEYVTRESRAQG
ncbi:metal-dependent hydrolase [Natronobacterium texcoconense]|uniref:LexA-binding, inner membrane-associated putative hydrolase n=1 Tax=Natronobacterium texcoconense TaxID=1095778 RepID=A0A1H0ZQ76_NATTX|nr:metal-dependent hydrolase [Natronobacterium texcoconense]SDQ29590.1 LexA-binding, inner membrane-associated putative hydrolase [Natronobacterium texcoconense]